MAWGTRFPFTFVVTWFSCLGRRCKHTYLCIIFGREEWDKLTVFFFRKRYISKLKANCCTLSTMAGVAFILLSWDVN